MNTKQPEALRLADALDWLAALGRPEISLSAEELRRLHSVNAELLEALKGVLKIDRGTSGRIIIELWQEEAIRAAIAKAQETV